MRLLLYCSRGIIIISQVRNSVYTITLRKRSFLQFQGNALCPIVGGKYFDEALLKTMM